MGRGVQPEQLVGMLLGVGIICLIDLVLSPIILRAAVAAFNALARMASPAPAPSKKRLRDGEPVRKKRKKPADAYPEPSGFQAVAVAFLTIAGTLVPGFFVGAAVPSLVKASGWEFTAVAVALRILVQSLILTAMMSADFFRSAGVAVLDTLVRVLLTGVGLLTAWIVMPQ